MKENLKEKLNKMGLKNVSIDVVDKTEINELFECVKKIIPVLPDNSFKALKVITLLKKELEEFSGIVVLDSALYTDKNCQCEVCKKNVKNTKEKIGS